MKTISVDDMLVMRNKYGEIPVGTRVCFQVENANMWVGDTDGILNYDGIDFVIDTKRSGRITINKGYDAYFNTIRPAVE